MIGLGLQLNNGIKPLTRINHCISGVGATEVTRERKEGYADTSYESPGSAHCALNYCKLATHVFYCVRRLFLALCVLSIYSW